MSRVLLLIGLPLTLAACDDPKPADSGDPATTQDTDDTVTPDDTGEPVGDTPTLAVDRLVQVSPPTLPETEGGRVQVQLVAAATDADGHDVALADAVAGHTFTAEFTDGSTAEAAVEVGDTNVLVVSFDVPPGLAPHLGARTIVALTTHDGSTIDVPVGLHVDPTLLLAQFAADPTGHIPVPEASDTLGTVCGTALVDVDQDGRVEVLLTSVRDGGFRVTGCFASEEGAWTCTDETLAPDRSSGDLVCGTTHHFRTSADTTGILATAQDAEGSLFALSGVSWDGSGWSGGGVDDVAATAQFGVLIGFNNTKQEPESPQLATMGTSGSTGGWGGLYQDGAEPWEWSDLGTVSANAIGDGTAWAGLSGDDSLSGVSGGETLVWAVDAEKAREGADLLVHIVRPDADRKTMSWLRQVNLAHPGFTVETAAGSFGDLDGDGTPDLVVELWGEGQWSAHVILGATNKADGRPVVALAGAPDEPVAYFTQGDVQQASAPSTIGWSDDGSTLGAVLPVWSGGEAAMVRLEWDVSSLTTEGAADVSPSHRSKEGTRHTGSPDTKGVGICCQDRCASVPGFQPSARLTTGGGDGTDALHLAAGSRAFVTVDPGDDTVVITAKKKKKGAPKGQIRSPRVRAMLEVLNMTGPPTVEVEEVALLETRSTGTVTSVGDLEDDHFTVISFEPQLVPVDGATGDDPQPTIVRADLRIRYADQTTGRLVLPPSTTTAGTTTPVVLADAPTDDGGLLLGWRDGNGQAWLGLVDLTAAVSGETTDTVPFLQGPVPIGAPLVDDRGILGLSDHTPGMVHVSRTIIADTPFLSMEDLETRFGEWESPMDVPFNPGAGAFGGVAVLVGTERGGVETRYLPPTDSLDGTDTVVLVEAADLSEATRVPRLTATLVPDAPPLLVLTAPDGTTDLQLVDADGTRAARIGLHTFQPDALRAGRLTAADLNGDGISDLLLGHGGATEVVLSDGVGRPLPDTLDPTALAGFSHTLTGGGVGQEAPLDVAGGRGLTLGGPTLGDWTLEVD